VRITSTEAENSLSRGGRAAVVLLSDGKSTEGGDPLAAARASRARASCCSWPASERGCAGTGAWR